MYFSMVLNALQPASKTLFYKNSFFPSSISSAVTSNVAGLIFGEIHAKY
ncbi:hypothetical protein BLL52_4251 [Rhodoferax antarcticus ANT.BR]|uniref:Uncharacterized protein n=1 Tax=Rhodoferax antarcticus ANT.BR TaxID=1111071 RepID=A0A1Q8Y9L8_9BURK|nr:hypothetical protein BLL52_4251 [Rhodoferax antarcticus ANT.BR]